MIHLISYINVDLHEHDQRQLSTPIYKSPLQIFIDKLKDEVCRN